MNKHLHRIVFNAARGLRMVVQETAKSTGRGARKATSGGTGAGAGSAAVSVAAIAAALMSAPLHAQIVADPGAPGGQRPTVLVAPNGVPLVNIQTPSAAGVSRNAYSQFDVQRNGAILNNSRGNAQTQLGGWVQGNPWLATGSARVILNEVNSANPSQLRGYVEVAGPRTEVIIANPAGIQVQGGGFINVNRATLTTGTPQFNAQGSLDSFVVRGGSVSIDGAGLDAAKTDYAAILARAVQINAGIWANELKVVAGANQVSADSGQAAPTTGSGAAPSFALDVAALGGMYAGKITLVGTEAGVGVRNAGHIGAGAGGLVVTAAGRLENTGTLEGAKVELSSASDIDNRGGTIRQAGTRDISVTAPVLSNTQGGFIGAEPVAATPAGGGEATAGSGASGSTPEGTIGGGTAVATDSNAAATAGIAEVAPAQPATAVGPGAVSAAGTILNDGGRIYAGGEMSLNTPRIDNSGGTIAVGSLAVSGPNFSNVGGTLRVDRDFSATVSSFDNSGGTLQAGRLDIVAAGDLRNTGGTLVSVGDAKFSAGGSLDNANGTVAAAGSLRAQAGSMRNSGTVRAGGDAELTAAGALENTGAITAARDLAITAGNLHSTAGGVLGAGIRSDGSLDSVGDLSLVASQGLAAHGITLAAGTARLQGVSVDLSDSKTNGTTLSIQATQGNVTTSGATTVASDTLTITANAQAAQALVNEDGALSARQLQITASNIVNTRGGEIVQTGTGATTMAVSGAINNSAGRIASNGEDLRLAASTITNSGGKIEHAGIGTLRVDAGTYVGTNGLLLGNGALTLRAGGIDQAGGTINGQSIAIDTGALNNRAGQIIQRGAGSARITATGVLDNTDGLIATASGSGATLSVSASDIDNLRGRMSSDGDLTAQSAAGWRNDAGSIRADGNLNVGAVGQMTNAMGSIEAAGPAASLTVRATNLDNTDGRIANAGSGDATLTAARIVNARAAGPSDTGLIAANGKLMLQTATLDNGAGAMVSSGGTLDLAVTDKLTNRGRIASDGAMTFAQAAALLDNRTGDISSSGDLRIAVREVTNDAGRIVTTNASGADLSVAAQTFSNQGGTLASDRDLQLVLPGSYTNDSTLHAGRNLALSVGGTLTNTGTLEAIGTLRADAGSISNAVGARIQANAVDLNVNGAIDNVGEITGGTVKIGADSLTNSGAITGGDVSVTARTVANIGSQALIAATGDVSLWVGDSLTNRDGATIYSGRDIHIGANSALNADGYLANASTTVVNSAATIEAERDIDIAARTLLNERPGVAIEQVQSLDETHTLSMPSWWHNSNNNPNYYNPLGAVYYPYEIYYVNPADILESGYVVTPDGFTVMRVVVRTHANDTAFFSAHAGASGAYGHRERIALTEGTQVFYATGYQNGASNPDQVAGITTGVWQGEELVRSWDAPAPAFDANYGNCSTDCIRFFTQPAYTDPNSIMIRDTQVSGPSQAQSEITRDAHTTAVDDRLVAGAGTVGRIVAGGNIRVGFSESLTNRYSDIMAGGQLNLHGDPGATVDNVATTLYRRYSFDGIRNYASGAQVAYTRPDISLEIGSVSGVLSGAQGVSITGGTIRNVDTAAGTAANIVASVQLASGGIANGGSASSASGKTGADNAGAVGAVSAGGKAYPSGGLFTARPDPTSRYLFETRGEFTNYRTFASSDYLFNALGVDPDQLQKRLGDAFYEQRLVREQIAELTGRRFLLGYADDDTQYLALMTAGVTFAEQYDLRPGIALTSEQIKSLTSDIVWMETQTVTLPDGTQQQVLVPKVYLAEVGANALRPNGALITGDNIYIDGANIVNRGGTIGGQGTQRAVLVASADIVNEGGTLKAGKLGLQAAGSIRNETLALIQNWGQSEGSVSASGSHSGLSNMGRIEATDRLQIQAGGDFIDKSGVIKSSGSASIRAGGDVVFDTVSTGSSSQANVGSWTMRREESQTQVGTLTTGGDLTVSADRDLTFNGTQVSAGGNAGLSAGRNLSIEAVTSSSASDQRNDPTGTKFRQTSSETTVQGASVKAGGGLVAVAGKNEAGNLSVIGSQLEAGGTVVLQASQDIVVADARATSSRDDFTHTSNNGFLSKKSTTDHQTETRDIAVGSSVSGKNVLLSAENDVIVTGSYVGAQEQLALSGGRDVKIQSAEDRSSQSSFHAESKSGFSASLASGVSYEKSAGNQTQTGQSTTQVGSVLSGANVSIDSGRDTQIIASAVVADDSVAITAGRNIDILQRTDTESSTNASQSSGMSLGLVSGLAPRQTLYGTLAASGNGTGESRTAVTSLISANGGSLTMVAGLDSQYSGTGQGNITTEGADLLARDKVALSGNAVNLNAAMSSGDSTYHAESRSVTLGAQLTGTVGGQITRAYDMAQASRDTSDSRLQGAQQLKAGYDAYKLATNGALGAGIADAGAAGTNGDPSGSAFGVSVSVSSSKSRQDSAESFTNQRGTNIQAGSIDITARETDINASGAKLQARDIELDAYRDINLGAAVNTAETRGSNSGSSLGFGVTAGFGSQNGISFQLSAGSSKGTANGTEVRYDNTLVSATDTLTIRSGGDTNLIGAQLTADQVKASIGGNLNIESLQDRTEYESKQSSGGFDVSICVPPICYGQVVTASANYAKQSVDHNYRSATGQSGIAAGNGGFDITVKGNTDLKGGAITSTAPIDKNSFTTGSLTTSDLTNRQNTDSRSESLSVSYGSAASMATNAATSVTNTALGNLNSGKGLPADKNETSQTLSVISPSSVKITGTGNAEVDAKSAENVATLTSRDASTANGALVNNLTLQQAQDIPRQQQEAADRQRAAQLVGSVIDNVIGDVSAKNGWAEGGAAKIALHGLAGIVQAKIGDGSALAGAAAGMANEALLPVMTEYLESQGIHRYNPNGTPNAEFGALLTAGSTLLGAAVGAAGGNAGLGAMVANNATVNNRLLHENEKAKIKQLANGDPVLEQQLTDAACFMVQCSAGKADADPAKAAAQATEQAVASNANGEYSHALTLLKNAQTAELFNYTEADQRLDRLNAIDPRNAGGLNAQEKADKDQNLQACRGATGCVDDVNRRYDRLVSDRAETVMTTINVINAYNQCAGGDTSCVAESLVQMKALQADLKTKGVKLEDSERIGLNSYIASAEAALGNGYGALSAAAMGAAGAKGNEAGNAGGSSAVPLGRGSTGRSVPSNLKEQFALEQALSNPAAGSLVPLRNGLTDPRWPSSDGWVKMTQNINGVEIHYVRNTNTAEVDDFKFK